MFIGHFAVGFALKRVAPSTSLGVLVAAPQFLDLLWPWFLLAGWEQVRIDPGNTAFTPLAFDSYPWSHSLLFAGIWGVAVGGAYALARGRTRAAVWLALAVVSHWVLDWLTHRPDLPLSPWSDTRLGLGLWNSVPATVAIESALFAVGVWMYAQTRHAGRFGFYALAATLVLIYVMNLVGPPPPDERSVAFVTCGLWVFVVWAAWVDRSRAAPKGPA